MKKLCKFLATTFSLVAVLGGAYYVYQNFVKGSKEETEDFDDFEDFEDFDDFDDLDDLSEEKSSDSKTSSSREYVTLDMEKNKAASVKEEKQEDENVTVFDLNPDEA